MQSDRDARIRDRAYRIWVEEGRAEGKHDEHWRRAEREIAADEARSGGATSGMTQPGQSARVRAKAAGSAEAAPRGTGVTRATKTESGKAAAATAKSAGSGTRARTSPATQSSSTRAGRNGVATNGKTGTRGRRPAVETSQ